MDFGFEIVGAKPKGQMVEPAAVQPMRVGDKIRRNPSTDQKSTRRQLQRSVTKKAGLDKEAWGNPDQCYWHKWPGCTQVAEVLLQVPDGEILQACKACATRLAPQGATVIGPYFSRAASVMAALNAVGTGRGNWHSNDDQVVAQFEVQGSRLVIDVAHPMGFETHAFPLKSIEAAAAWVSSFDTEVVREAVRANETLMSTARANVLRGRTAALKMKTAAVDGTIYSKNVGGIDFIWEYDSDANTVSIGYAGGSADMDTASAAEYGSDGDPEDAAEALMRLWISDGMHSDAIDRGLYMASKTAMDYDDGYYGDGSGPIETMDPFDVHAVCPNDGTVIDTTITRADQEIHCPQCGARIGGNDVTVTGSKKIAWSIADVKKVVDTQSFAKVDGMTLDLFSASGLAQVYDALSPENQAKLAAMTLDNAVNVAFMLIKKGSKVADASAMFDIMDKQMAALKNAKSNAEVFAVTAVGDGESPRGFWAGDGGELWGVLHNAGWTDVRYESDYEWAIQAPNGDILTNVEGDLYPGMQLMGACKTADLDSDFSHYQQESRSLGTDRAELMHTPEWIAAGMPNWSTPSGDYGTGANTDRYDQFGQKVSSKTASAGANALLQDAVIRFSRGQIELNVGDRFGDSTITDVGSDTVQYIDDDGWSGSMQLLFNDNGVMTPAWERAYGDL